MIPAAMAVLLLPGKQLWFFKEALRQRDSYLGHDPVVSRHDTCSNGSAAYSRQAVVPALWFFKEALPQRDSYLGHDQLLAILHYEFIELELLPKVQTSARATQALSCLRNSDVVGFFCDSIV